ncbi:acyl-coenzyme A thioesterase 13 [Cinnamomum micranthum f. kanehirae]|uniref:Acyl-coenzyme A thioesterase 13 n=1 Tax=Cinnamomum micranthum f. kanehirae TaxID=337451 RepID=A0A443PA43_9MAGN|nr:acyl-coenzyme A thioesterase 13 [Cinnamomum micranthum f. kanehirae]
MGRVKDGDESSPGPNEQERRISVAKAILGVDGPSLTIPDTLYKKDALGDLIRALLKVQHIEPGRITCTFTVNPSFTNAYNTLHGGAVGVISEAVALGCVRSVAGDKDFFLGEWAASYLSAARLKEELQVDGVVIRHGRSIIVTSVEFRIKQTRKLIYSVRATFYSIPAAHL